uniref:Uncharacterized protein n=1 Tax=Melopsittacus undulatus TaxID=13146 RepID=A0A8C6IWB7_MELUD
VSFPVDILINSSHEDLKISGDKYLSNLRSASPNCPEYLSLPVPIKLSTVGFVPLYGEEHTHRVLALFSPKDSITAVALYLADKWWSVDDIVRTSVSARQGLHQVKSVGERIVLYVLNRIIYRTQEMGRNETPFLCHRSNEYAKIMWKGGEAIGFYSVKPTACKQYLEKYPSDESLLYEVNGPGYWFQRTCVAAVVQRERLQFEGMDALICFLANISFVHWHLFWYPNIAPASMRTRSSHLKCPRIGRMRQESGTSQGNEENTFETVSEPLNGEITEDTHKTSTVFEEETANEVQSSESKLQSESQEEPLVLFVPLILESSAKPSEDTISEKGTTVGDSEMLTEESTLKEENTEEQQEPEKAATENAAASASKEEPSDNGLPNSMVTEAVEESVSENVSLKTASSLEDQSEEGEHNSQEPPVALNQSSLVMVELDGASFQQPSGQEAKNQLEEQSEETVEQMEQYTQTERAADSSSEEAEIEVPVVDRRSLRRKVKSYKGPPKKKGKSV